MQNYGFLFRILHNINGEIDFNLLHVYIIGKNHYAGKRNEMFVS